MKKIKAESGIVYKFKCTCSSTEFERTKYCAYLRPNSFVQGHFECMNCKKIYCYYSDEFEATTEGQQTSLFNN